MIREEVELAFFAQKEAELAEYRGFGNWIMLRDGVGYGVGPPAAGTASPALARPRLHAMPAPVALSLPALARLPVKLCVGVAGWPGFRHG